jgi:hypothetical protein
MRTPVASVESAPMAITHAPEMKESSHRPPIDLLRAFDADKMIAWKVGRQLET